MGSIHILIGDIFAIEMRSMVNREMAGQPDPSIGEVRLSSM